MKGLIYPLPRGSQPQELVEQDQDNLLSARLGARFLFNEGGGDLHNLGTDGPRIVTPAGSPTWGADSIGRVLLLNGSGQYVPVSTNSATQVIRAADVVSGSGFTLAARVKFTFSNSDKYLSVLGGVNASGNINWLPGIFWHDGIVGTQVRATIYDGAYVTALSSGIATATATGRWTHVAAVFDSKASLIRIYVDGVADGTASFNPAAATFEPVLFNVGRFPGTLATAIDANGPITDVRVYRRALSAAEIFETYARPYQDLVPQIIPVAVATGAVIHATSGALTGASSVITGSAAHVAKHATSGALTGPGSSVVGSAARTRAHPSTGALVGPGSAIAGDADHTTPGSDHATSGALVGPGSIVSGLAAHIAVHQTSGLLVGPGSLISGSAQRTPAPVTHATSGALIGPGSQIVGYAANESTSPSDTHDGYWSRLWRDLAKPPELEEVVEYVRENAAQVLAKNKTVRRKLPNVAYAEVRQSHALQLKIARQIIKEIRQRQIDDEEDEIEALLMV